MQEPQQEPKGWCFAWYAGDEQASEGERAALIKKAKWDSGAVITVSFIDGDAGLQDKVKRYATDWTAPGLANLTLDFRNDPNTSVRISFQEGGGSWSVLGTTCNQVPKDRATMNYGWLRTANDAEARRVIEHEFGHALGLIHEHQNPVNGIKWNKPAVIRALSGPPNSWSQEQIEHNLFAAYERCETNYTQLDPHSIMMYPIPKEFTLDGFSVGMNSELSETDKRFIREQYP